jgi:hypothetical protein
MLVENAELKRDCLRQVHTIVANSTPGAGSRSSPCRCSVFDGQPAPDGESPGSAPVRFTRRARLRRRERDVATNKQVRFAQSWLLMATKRLR